MSGNIEIPTPEYLILKSPLYKKYEMDSSIFNEELNSLYFYSKPIDLYCPECGRDSIYYGNEVTPDRFGEISSPFEYPEKLYKPVVITLKYYCTRNNYHIALFTFLYHHGEIQKTGQYPSIASTTHNYYNRYSSILNGKELELKKAVGLISHGIGVGSFVYLRRVFEYLIELAHSEAINASDWNEDEYSKCQRMGEKIEKLHVYLPALLTENKILYPILSAGIHTLSENECLEYFQPIRLIIELILDEKLKAIAHKKKVEEAKNNIQHIRQSLKST